MGTRPRTRIGAALAAGLTAAGAAVVGAAALVAPAAGAGTPAYLTTLGAPAQVGSTVPANGDVNPYGIAVVPESVGHLVAGDTLVSNFNDQANVQGTGTTLVEVSPSGQSTTFATVSSLPPSVSCPGGVGLDTALGILPGGWVVVGSLPAGPGGALPSANPAGCLLVLNRDGVPVESWHGPALDGPWDMAVRVSGDSAQLFVADALTRAPGTSGTPTSGHCDVVRVDLALWGAQMPTVSSTTVIGTGFPWQANAAAFVEAPTGLALGSDGTLYVAETIGSSITAIPDAPTRSTAVRESPAVTLTANGALNGPLGLTLAPDGDLVAVNGGDGKAVEITPSGRQVAAVTLVPDGAGDLFGVTVAPGSHDLEFTNDGTNALDEAVPG